MSDHGMLHLFEVSGVAANCLPKGKKMNEVSLRFELDPNTRTRTTRKWSRTLRIAEQNSAGISHFFHNLFTRKCQNFFNDSVGRSMKKRTSCTFLSKSKLFRRL